jgi:tRNA(Ile)-lysidine synthase TilS/MesJ
MQTYFCFRPLLSFSKLTITQRCDRFGIPYHLDIHNTDSTQKRIYYRNRIQQIPAADQQRFYEEWKWVYAYLQKTPPPAISLKSLPYPSFWSIEGLYLTSAPSTIEHLVALLSTLSIFTNMSKVRLHEMMKWFQKKQ